MAKTNKEYTANSTDNVSSTKGVRGGYCFIAPLGATLPTYYNKSLTIAFQSLTIIN